MQQVKELSGKREEKQKQKLELLHKLGEIIKDYNGLESNIPLTHEYWNLLGRFRVE